MREPPTASILISHWSARVLSVYRREYIDTYNDGEGVEGWGKSSKVKSSKQNDYN